MMTTTTAGEPKTWERKSERSGEIYLIRMATDGALSCTCKGFMFKKPGKARECSHITKLIAENGWTRMINGETVGVANPAAVDVVAPTQTQPIAPMSAPLPMLAIAMTDDAPRGAAFEAKYPQADYILDEKIDGYRCIIVKRGELVKGWSRPRSGGNGPLSVAVPQQIAEALSDLPDCILDGELQVPGGKSWDVTSARVNNPGALIFTVFDVLEAMGQSTINESQDIRREVLTMLLAHTNNHAIRLVPSFEVSWAAVEAIWEAGGEGAIVKARAARYRPGYRSDAWAKVVKAATATMTVVGFLPGKLGPYSALALEGPVAVKSVKTLNGRWISHIAVNPAAFLGRRLVISYTPRGDKPMHPRADHWAGEGE